ncbi:MAG: hypothetical protein RJA91_125 [Pseudomonadota bacterium]|jgi:uncharacterized coiled-coil DUF342 family protein
MNAQEAISKIRALFEDNVAPVEMEKPIETKVEMKEYSLEDGTKVMISALEIGGEVKLEDGSAAPVGEHKLADGSSIKVDENGIIVEISSPAEEALPEEEMKKEEDKKMQEMQDQLNSEIAKLRDEKSQLEAKIQELNDQMKKGFNEVASLFEAITTQPSADPIEKPNSFQSFITTNDIREERLSRYRNAILNNKK